jgi:hypothetical protein
MKFMDEYLGLGHMEAVPEKDERPYEIKTKNLYYSYLIMPFLRNGARQQKHGLISTHLLKLLQLFQ